VIKTVDLVGGHLEREAGLAGAARTGEGKQTDRLALDAGADLAQLGLASDERRGLGGQVVGSAVGRRQRREGLRERRVDQLEELLRPPQILEPMGAEVHQGGAVGKLVGHQGG